MFGWFRFIAALLVVVGHIARVEFVAGIAVWGFFMLSGFLMAAILNKKYGFSARGIRMFALSRTWRLFPSYWASSVATIMVIWLCNSHLDATIVNPALAFPVTVREIFAGVLIVGHTTLGLGRVENSLSPSAWAVEVEIMMYAVSCLMLARSRRVALATSFVLVLTYPGLWLVARYYVEQHELVVASQIIYSFLPAALLPYALGTLMWFYRNIQIPVIGSKGGAIIGCIALAICTLVIARYSVTLAFLLLLPALVLILSYLRGLKMTKRARFVDEFVGRLSYPIYLLHWLGAYLTALLFGGENGKFFCIESARVVFSPLGVAWSMVLIMLMSVAMTMFVENPLEKMRQRWLECNMKGMRK